MLENNIVGNVVKYYVFVRNEHRHFNTQHITAGVTTVKWIFPVPESNAVGTIDEDSNGIVFLKFGDYGVEPQCQIIAQNFSEMVYGPFEYSLCSNFFEDTIVYCKTRVAVVANVKTGEVFHAECGLSMLKNDYMRGIRFLDPQDNLYVIVKSIKAGKSQREDYLYIVKLEGQEFVDIGWAMKIGGERHISPGFPLYNAWHVHARKLFVYDQERHKIECTNGKVSVTHPFSEVFNANSSSIGMVKDIAIHPALPFGIIIEQNVYGTHDMVVLRWDITSPKKKDKQLLSLGQALNGLRHLFGLDRLTLAYPSFSPDGNWYVVGLIAPDEPQSPHFVTIPVVPVDKKHSYFLDVDNIVILGQVSGLTSIAWTSEPTSYVVSDGEILHKWDLDELPNARVFVVPVDGEGRKKGSIFRKAARLFGVGK